MLRINRPDYTPRTGFVWPITDPTISDDTSKKWGADEPSTAAVEGETAIPTSQSESQKPASTITGPKKQQNNMLMYNAMRSTAIHSKISFSSSASARDGDSVPPESLGVLRAHSSATPVPAVTRAATPASGPTPQDTVPTKGAPGAGKKKKKRMFD
jgi:mediator of RNA polymerase II transcription subunit 6